LGLKIRYQLLLPIAFLSIAWGNPSGKVIAKIPEASGISYCNKDDSLIVVNDEGSYYKINRKGKILQKKKLGKYDLEGVVCEDDELFFAIENKGVLIVDSNSGHKKKISLDLSYHGKKISLFNKKAGIEGIAKHGTTIFLSKQSKKKKKSFIAVVELKPHHSKIIDILEHHIADTSGLTYHDGYLYMVSDKKDLLIKYDFQKKKIIQKVKLDKGDWEGIAFDNKGFVYLADDAGRVVKYKKKALGL